MTERIDLGSEFQNIGPATEEAREPNTSFASHRGHRVIECNIVLLNFSNSANFKTDVEMDSLLNGLACSVIHAVKGVIFLTEFFAMALTRSF